MEIWVLFPNRRVHRMIAWPLKLRSCLLGILSKSVVVALGPGRELSYDLQQHL